MKVLIAGLGSIGSRHLKNLNTVEPNADAVVWHQHSKPSSGTEDSFPAVPRVYSLEEALNTRPDAALITGPATTHIRTGLELARHNIHLFVEKPLSDKMDGVEQLLSLCYERSLVLMVGYNFRFYEPLQAIKKALQQQKIGRVVSIRAEAGQYLPDWRPSQDYRQTVSARRELGGGVLLELSHELDYVRWLFGEVQTVRAHTDALSGLDIDVEDVAEIILEFCDGAIGSVHLDMVQRAVSRSCRIVGTEGSITWDRNSHRARLFSAVTNSWTDLHPAVRIDSNDMYVAELRHFLDCVAGKHKPAVSGEDGKYALQIALAARQSSEEKRAVKL